MAGQIHGHVACQASQAIVAMTSSNTYNLIAVDRSRLISVIPKTAQVPRSIILTCQSWLEIIPRWRSARCLDD